MKHADARQADIIREMRVLPTIDPAFEARRRTDFIKQTLLNSGSHSLVLGISGGIDSCTCGRLAQLAEAAETSPVVNSWLRIAPDNTVASIKLADARIAYSQTGTLAHANGMGWFSKFFNSPLWPF